MGLGCAPLRGVQDEARLQSLGARAPPMLTTPRRNREASVWLICKVDRSWRHPWGSHLPGRWL